MICTETDSQEHCGFRSPEVPEPGLGESGKGSWESSSRGEELICKKNVVGSGEFERSEDIGGMINIHVWDERGWSSARDP